MKVMDMNVLEEETQEASTVAVSRPESRLFGQTKGSFGKDRFK